MAQQIVFLSHDPGGYDVTYPVYKRFIDMDISCVNYCMGPAGKLNPVCKADANVVRERLLQGIADGTIAALITGRSATRQFELEMIQRCQENRIPTFFLLDYWSDYLYSFIYIENKIVLPDYYIVMDDLAYKEAITDGVPAKILHVLGQPGLDRYITGSEYISPPIPRLLILSQPVPRMDEILSDITEVAQDTHIPFNIKFHPRDDVEIIRKWQSSNSVVEGDLIQVLDYFTLIVGVSTMGLLHAALKRVPVISYEPFLNGKDMCITNKLGITKRLSTKQELKQAMLSSAQPDFDGKYLWCDGNSTGRISDFILKNTGLNNRSAKSK